MPTANRVRIITNRVSEGATALTNRLRELGVDASRINISAGERPQNRLNIKWGTFENLPPYGGELLNSQADRRILNKLVTFNALAALNVAIPEFTTDRDVALSWFEGVRAGRMRVYERHNLTGSEGDGIVVCESADTLGTAPLYTKGMRGVRREYRIHVFQQNGVKRVFIQQKKRRQGFAEAAGYTNTVRNLEGGWIFAHNDIQAPRQQTIDLAVGATVGLRLNFAAVDVIEMNDAALGSVVLELNSAPGLAGGTVDFYATAILDTLNGVVDTVPTSEAVVTPGYNPYEDDEDDDEDDDY